MGEAVGDGSFGAGRAIRPVHRLEEAVVERQVLDGFGQQIWLGVDELELIAGGQHDVVRSIRSEWL